MRFFEFAETPKTTSKLNDLDYLLSHADVNLNTLQNALNFLKKDDQKNQQKKQPQEPTGQQKTQPTPNLNQLTMQDKVSEDNSGTDLKQEVMKFAETASPDSLQKVLYYISLDTFKSMASDIIKLKIKIKASAITEQIHLAISDLAGKTSVKTMTDFLNDCKAGGVINASLMIKSGISGLQPIPISKKEYAVIVQRLLDTSLAGAAATGRGEIGLSFAGINAVKGEKDITIDGVDVEVKASRRRSDFFFKGQTGFEATHTKIALAKLVKKLNSVGGQFSNTDIVDNGGISQINPKTIKILQPYFLKLGQNEVQNLLIDIILEIHKSLDVSKFNDEIKGSVNSDGTIDYNKLVLATSKISFYYYQQLEKHPGVLMLNITNLTYDYQEDASDFADSVSNGIITPTSAINFRNTSKGSLTFKLN
jgi:hypothetical protein